MGSLLLALDVGNTHTVVGLFDGTKLRTTWRLSTGGERTADELGMLLRQLQQWQGIEADALGGVAIASVVPRLDARLDEAVRRYLDHQPFFVHPEVNTGGMALEVARPEELGADRLCDAVAARARYGGPAVVIDFGTAVTWEVVSAEGSYLGGAIAPGPGITADALFSRASKLPTVPLAPPPRSIGIGTTDSIQIGLFYGYIGLVEGVTRRILGELGPATVIATGGFAATVAEHCGLIDTVDEQLTLEGLRLLWQLAVESR
jgi:type III pantothenate kinase